MTGCRRFCSRVESDSSDRLSGAFVSSRSGCSASDLHAAIPTRNDQSPPELQAQTTTRTTANGEDDENATTPQDDEEQLRAANARRKDFAPASPVVRIFSLAPREHGGALAHGGTQPEPHPLWIESHESEVLRQKPGH
jgi:hypothetical protein